MTIRIYPQRGTYLKWLFEFVMFLEAPKYTPPPISSIFEICYVSLSVDAAHTTISFVSEVYQTSIFKPVLESYSWPLEGAILFSGILSHWRSRSWLHNFLLSAAVITLFRRLLLKLSFSAQLSSRQSSFFTIPPKI